MLGTAGDRPPGRLGNTSGPGRSAWICLAGECALCGSADPQAGGADSVGIDEIEVLDTSGTNVAEGKLYTVEGYQDWFATPEASEYELGEARHLPDSTNVRLPAAVLYLKGQGFGYLETTDRAAGLRFEGEVDAQPGDLVTLTGSMGTTPGGEKYVQVRSMTVVGTGRSARSGMNGGNLLEPMVDASRASLGALVPGSVTDNSFRITTFNGRSRCGRTHRQVCRKEDHHRDGRGRLR